MDGRLKRLVERYIEIASLVGRIGVDDSRAGNRAHKRLTGVVRQLAAFGEDAKRVMMPLLDHENVDVRLYTAAQVLASRTAEEAEKRRAEEVCESARRLPGLAGFSAEMTLKEWRDGKLGPPFPVSPFK